MGPVISELHAQSTNIRIVEPDFARYSINYFRYYNYAVWQDLTDLVALSDIAGA